MANYTKMTNSSDPIIIAIDGPAASGKSTVARRVAESLDYLFVNSGEMYRAFTWKVLDQQIDPADVEKVLELLNQTEFTCGQQQNVGTIAVDGQILTEAELKSDAINSSVSAIAAIPEVRSRLVEQQRSYGELNSLVMEGRDIGSVVFPDTPYKFFIDASPEIRAARRSKEGITDSIKARDLADSKRKASPLKVPDGAMQLDSSHIGAEEVVELVLDAIRWKSATL